MSKLSRCVPEKYVNALKYFFETFTWFNQKNLLESNQNAFNLKLHWIRDIIWCLWSELSRADWNNRPSWVTTFNKILQNPLANIHRHKLILIPTWINNYIHYNVRDKNSYPFPNVDGATVEVGECISNFTVPFTSHVTKYPCMDERDRCW